MTNGAGKAASVTRKEAATPERTNEASRWIRDGHTARVVLWHDELSVQFVCPNEGVLPEVTWDSLPSCRKPYGEDGQPDYDHDGALSYCNFIEWATDGGEPLAFIDTDLTRGEWLINGEFPIGWRWDDGCYVWAPSALIDAAGVAS